MLGDKFDVTAVEAKWRERWLASGVYAWNGQEPREGSYIIDTPPPTVSGVLHMGHIYSYTQTDLLARFMRMSGRNVYYPMGFDDNGLPTERLVEKTKGIRAADMTREQFVAICHEVVKEAEDDFRDLFQSVALSVDWSLEYQTISDHSVGISQASALDLYSKGHLYRKLEPTLWDPADRTALAQAEVVEKEMPGALYQVPFDLEGGGTATIATTRPELLGACCALLVHPSHPRAGELVGRTAVTPLFGVPVPVLADERVDPEKGTGVVMCCTFGDSTDIEWWRDHNLPTRVIIDKGGRITDMADLGGADWPSRDLDAARATIARLAGLKVAKARETIVEILTEAGRILGKTDVVRMVPCAERSGAPLEILVTPQWFVRLLDKKERLLERGRQIAWYPDYMRGRYESWVQNLKWDWCISRQRYFGVPFPFWYSKRKGEEGKIIHARFEDLPVNPLVTPPHGYTMDEVEPDPDVMDTWATSSVSPQINSGGVAPGFMIDADRHAKLFPATLRPQAHEIIRTWAFYTIAKSELHQGTVPWTDIAISGWCLAEDRSKMSKSKGNVVTPRSLLERYGTDVVRYWTATSRLGLDTALSEDVLKIGKKLTTKLWNASRFVGLQLQGFTGWPSTPAGDAAHITEAFDRWILSRLAEVVEQATALYARYEYADALNAIERFFWDEFCDNYLELVKGRAYGEVGTEAARASAHYTLWHCLETLLRLFAPTLPFMAEEIHSGLFAERNAAVGSVHARGNWPKAEEQFKDAGAIALGRAGIAMLAGVRKVKTANQVSIKTPVTVCRVAPGPNAPAGLEAGLPALEGDLKAAMNAERLDWAATLSGADVVAEEDGIVAVQAELAPVQAA